MKMNKRLACVILLLSAIAIEVIWCFTMYLAIGIIPFLGVVSDLMPKENSCLSSRPPASFSKANLVGTWVARRLGDSDTLIIRGDGTYKQIIHLDIPAVDYESDWQPWWLEYHASGILYLHLKEMRFCAINPSISCDRPTGSMAGYDFCEDQTITMDNEGILIVLGKTLDFPMGSENSWFYSKP